MLLSVAIGGFILHRTADGLAAGTLTTYKWALARLLAHAGDVDAASLTPEHMRRFMADCRTAKTARGSPLAHKSLENIWIALKAFDAWAQAELHLAPLAADLKRPAGEYDAPQPFTDDDIRQLLKAAARTRPAASAKRPGFTMPRRTAQRDAALILVLLDTGLRAGEACRLRACDVDMQSGAVVVAAHGSGKKTKTRTVYIGRSTTRAVWRMLTSTPHLTDGPLFATSTGRALTPNGILHILQHLGRAAGVADTHPHRFRHTFAIQYLRNGGDVFTLQRLLGHSSLEMVRRYLALADADAATAHQRASPADRWRL